MWFSFLSFFLLLFCRLYLERETNFENNPEDGLGHGLRCCSDAVLPVTCHLIAGGQGTCLCWGFRRQWGGSGADRISNSTFLRPAFPWGRTGEQAVLLLWAVWKCWPSPAGCFWVLFTGSATCSSLTETTFQSLPHAPSWLLFRGPQRRHSPLAEGAQTSCFPRKKDVT